MLYIDDDVTETQLSLDCVTST